MSLIIYADNVEIIIWTYLVKESMPFLGFFHRSFLGILRLGYSEIINVISMLHVCLGLYASALANQPKMSFRNLTSR